MPRPHTILQSDFPYHVTARCINREWFALPMDQVWEIMTTQLTYITYVYGVKIHSFVLMNNHFHLLISTPHANLSIAMRHFMKETSCAIAAAAKRINQIYGGSYYRSILRCHQYYMQAYKYVYYNPVQAGLVAKVELYPYGTLRGLLGFCTLDVPLAEDTLLMEDVEGILNWMNEKPKPESWGHVREAIRKKEFKFRKDKMTRRELYLENDLL